MRFLLTLALLCCAVFLLCAFYSRYIKAPQEGRNRQSNANVPESSAAEAMLQCGQCGVYFPSSEAVSGPSNSVFCSEDHRRKHFSAH